MTDGLGELYLAYLSRLGCGVEPPSVAALAALHRAQTERIAYETLWIHLGEQRSVAVEDSLDAIARRGRGGYCFHLNGAFASLLTALGYEVTLHAGAAHDSEGPTRPLGNHLVLLVHGLPTEAHPNGTWYVDAGLGDALHDPLPLAAGRYTQGPFTFELRPSPYEGSEWQLVHDSHGSFHAMVFSLEPVSIDYFAEHHVRLSTSPDSGFVKTLTAQRRLADHVEILRARTLTRLDETGPVREILERDDWFAAVIHRFGLNLDDVSPSARDALWDRVEVMHDDWMAGQQPHET